MFLTAAYKHPSVRLSARLSVRPSVRPSVRLSVPHVLCVAVHGNVL